jgi:hypothetical protein
MLPHKIALILRCADTEKRSLLARRDILRRCNGMSEIGGTADIRALRLLATAVANDPTATFAAKATHVRVQTGEA